ncbi:hypothetical protein McaMca56_000072 [Microsporum canis]
MIKGLWKPQYESYMLLILSPDKELTYVHLYPGGHYTDISYSSPPTLPHCVSFKSRVPLGKLPVRTTEGQGLKGVIDRLQEFIKKAYQDDIADSENNAVVSYKDKSVIALRRCERALHQGFSMLTESQAFEATTEFCTVDLVQIYKPQKGSIIDLRMKSIAVKMKSIVDCQEFTILQRILRRSYYS